MNEYQGVVKLSFGSFVKRQTPTIERSKFVQEKPVLHQLHIYLCCKNAQNEFHLSSRKVVKSENNS